MTDWISWERIREIIESGKLDLLTRSPEQKALYYEAREQFKSEGGVAPHMISRLGWQGENAKALSYFLEDERDWAYMPNDFPYNFGPKVKHMVLWSKVRCPLDDTGAISLEGRQKVETWIKNNLDLSLVEVQWFRNPRKLQTVSDIEHLHILVRPLE